MKVFAPFAWNDRKGTGIGEVLYNSAENGIYDPQGIIAVLLTSDNACDGFAILRGIHNEVDLPEDLPSRMEILLGYDRCEMSPLEYGADPEEGFLADEADVFTTDEFLDFAREVLNS